MEKPAMSVRKELAEALLSELEAMNSQLAEAASAVEKCSGEFYEDAFNEKHQEMGTIMESYQQNVARIKDINNEITVAINSWYEFIKNENETGKITFPLIFLLKKKALNKKIKALNNEISNITINNRFIKEQLMVLEHQLEIKAVSLARSGGNYVEYEKLLLKKKAMIDELKYLLPTIPGTCPADLSPGGLGRLKEQCQV